MRPMALVSANADAPQGDNRSVTTEQKLLLLGEATFLFLNSPLHLRYAVHQLPTFILTPLRLAQYRMYRGPQGPVGFVAWAYLTAQAAGDYASQRRELTPQDWNAGNQLWFIEFVAPFGHGRRIVSDLRTNVFPRATALSLRRHTDGRVPAVVGWRGVDVVAAVATESVGQHEREAFQARGGATSRGH